MLYKLLVRPPLFWLTKDDAERAHDWMFPVIRAIGNKNVTRNLLTSFASRQYPELAQTLFGVHFPNPVGLAAGFDKNGMAVQGMAALGFGFLEVGTVTWHEQQGNPRPRIFRLPQDRALINRMGFNNEGSVSLANALRYWGKPKGIPIGISIGKSAVTPLERAAEDYLFSLKATYSVGDYFVINISSPNTPGLRSLQGKQQFMDIARALVSEADRLSWPKQRKPILVKIAPDLSYEAITDVLDVSFRHGIAGIIASNTSLGRERIKTATSHVGGLSGKPLFRRAIDVVRFIRKEAGLDFPIIGVGGIFNARDAYVLLNAGANLVQIFTSLVYEGPFVVKRINRGIARLLRKEGLDSIAELNPQTEVTQTEGVYATR